MGTAAGRIEMTGRGARWMFVTVSLSVRSKEQRMHAAAFTRLLLGSGYVQLHVGAYLRYVPSRRRARAEASKLRTAFPSRGVLHVIELAPASLNRAIVIVDGAQVVPPTTPELLTVY